MRFPNPIGRRLERVRSTYKHRPEVFEYTLQIAKRTAGKDEIDPDSTEVWEEYLPWVASNVSKLAKKRDKGQVSVAAFEAEIERLGESFERIVRPFVERKAQGKGVKSKAKGRRVQLQQLSPKQARAHLERANQSKGFRVAKKLPGGYVAVVATPNLNAPKYPGKLNDPSWKGDAAAKKWVADNAPFQQWLGEKMGNCLQFYRVNYAPFGASKFERQREGGKLYAILNKSGTPVAATLTAPNGTIIETNGHNNKAPSGKDEEALDNFEKAMWGGKQDRGTFDVDTDPRLIGFIEHLSDETEDRFGVTARRKFIRQARRYARQNGFDGRSVFKPFAVYLLVGSKYSALNSVKKSKVSANIDIERLIVKVAHLISTNATSGELREAGEAAEHASNYFFGSASNASQAGGSAGRLSRGAAIAGYYAIGSASECAYELAVASGGYYGDRASAAISSASIAAHNASVSVGADVAAGSYSADYAEGLLKIMRKEAGGGGRLQRNPAKRKVTNKKVAKKKVAKKPARKKTPEWQLLCNRCAKLWDHYCERPSKTRLKPVLEHLEKMKASTSKKVADERKACLRVANKEARRLKMK